DPQGRKRGLTRSDSAAISNYLKDASVPQNNKGKPWKDIAINAGVSLPEVPHFKPPGMRSLSLKPIQKACKEDEGIINAVIEEERELDKRQCTNRLKFVDTSLEKRPHSVDYNNVAFCDEYHFGLGPEITHRIKRKRGRYYRYLPQNVHRKAATRKDKKEKAREKEHFKLFSIFVVIGKN
ncbi:uncharacterized protein K441DRAFT_576740, partial [Cenococcum geophilum 1.58]|uniref:uncharacterized protein n=1 Tax=Cenococcum geophilum 1.58 TaxID=794803 RepID=UPI00358E8553